jgi:hypothetical protein
MKKPKQIIDKTKATAVAGPLKIGMALMTFAQYLVRYRDAAIDPATKKRWTEADIVADSGLPADLVHEWFWLIAQTDQDVSMVWMRFATDPELIAAYQLKHPHMHPVEMANFGWMYAPDSSPDTDRLAELVGKLSALAAEYGG